MQELEVIDITNPTSEDFSWRYNGELFTIKAGEKRGFAKSVALHLAKHLSTKMVCDEALSVANKKDLADPKAAIHVKVSQLNTYDTHERRIALYKILGNVDLVLQVIANYPFKGFIGEMDIYQKFVEKSQPKVVAE
jgi:hypothetical protein